MGRSAQTDKLKQLEQLEEMSPSMVIMMMTTPRAILSSPSSQMIMIMTSHPTAMASTRQET